MPEAPVIAELRRELLRRGCPAKTVRRIVRESAEHYEDLRRSAEARSHVPAAAAQQAQVQMGDPVALAERHIAVLRQSTWWGRHPFWGFAAGPFLLTPFLLILSLALGCGVGLVCLGVYPGNPLDDERLLHGQPTMFICGHSGLFLGVVAMAVFLCCKVRQMARSGWWLLLVCGLISFYALILDVQFTINENAPYTNISAMFDLPPPFSLELHGLSFVNALMPWVVAGWLYLRERRAARLPAYALFE